MHKSQRDYIQQSLQNPSTLSNDNPLISINHINVSEPLPSKEDVINVINWINDIFTSTTKIRKLSFRDQNKMDNECIEQLFANVDSVPLKEMEFERISSGHILGYFHEIENDENVLRMQDILCVIYFKAKQCEKLVLNACGINGDELFETVCDFYDREDFYALRELKLKQIDIYDNPIEGEMRLFTEDMLTKLDKWLKKIFKTAEANCDRLNVKEIEINSNAKYLKWKLRKLKYVKYKEYNQMKMGRFASL